jgi:serine/threonine protein kinase
MLRHTHVLRNMFVMFSGSNQLLTCTISFPRHSEFLGANELDDKPFIVMPYLKNGNARDYVQSHPDCDRLRIVWLSLSLCCPYLMSHVKFHHISLGLVYLHSRKIVHGDLKAVSIISPCVTCFSFDGLLLAQCANR